MACKCGANSYTGHLKKTEDGYPAHVYTGHYWAPKDDKVAAGVEADQFGNSTVPDGGWEEYGRSMERNRT